MNGYTTHHDKGNTYYPILLIESKKLQQTEERRDDNGNLFKCASVVDCAFELIVTCNEMISSSEQFLLRLQSYTYMRESPNLLSGKRA